MNKITRATMRELGRYTLLALGVALSVLVAGWLLVTFATFAKRPAAITVSSSGEYLLLAKSARLLGKGGARMETYAGQENIGYWDTASQWLAWDLDIVEAGKYQVALHYARPSLDVDMQIATCKAKLPFTVSATGGWDKWKEVTLGTIDLTPGSGQELTLKVTRLETEGVINFVSLKLTPIE